MNKDTLQQILKAEKFNPRAYSLEGGDPSERLCLSDERSQWCVYYSERGLRTSERCYRSEFLKPALISFSAFGRSLLHRASYLDNPMAADDGELIFKRELLVRAVTRIVCPGMIIFSIWLFAYAFFFDDERDIVQGRISSIAMLLFSPMWFIVLRYTGDIHVSDNGIAWWVCGMRWRFIQWSELQSVTIDTITAWNFAPRIVTSYRLLEKRRRSMRFSDTMPDAQALVDSVMQHVQQCNVPVIDNQKTRR